MPSSRTRSVLDVRPGGCRIPRIRPHLGVLGQVDRATESIEFRFDEEIICGNEVAYIGSIVTHIAGHVSEARGGVFTYQADREGRLSALRAYWEVEKTINSVRKA